MAVKDRKCANFSSCGRVIYRDNKTGLCLPCYNATHAFVNTPMDPAKTIERDSASRRQTGELASLKLKYREALKSIDDYREMLSIRDALRGGLDPFQIVPKEGQGTSEGTVVVLASDWHVEERVDPATVNGRNDYNLDIAHARVTRFFQSLHRLTRLLQQDIKIHTVVLALLGDFISNDIHEEFADITQAPPMHALLIAQNMIVSGINFLLDAMPDVNFIIPCHSGNHARTTKTTRFAVENGHSLEFLMYKHLEDLYAKEPRVTVLVAGGYHSYLEIYGKTLRFHHGHSLHYKGGIGGLFIPTYRAIYDWNKNLDRPPVLDCFGHFHTQRDGDTFVSNGSLIGYSAFAISIKAPAEVPRQTLMLFDKKRGRTATWPILVEK